MGTNSGFALGPRTTMDTLDLVGWSHYLPNSSQEFLSSYTRTLTEVTLCAFALFVRNNLICCTEIFLVPVYE